MTKYTFFTIQNGVPYQELKKPLTFQNDPFGITNWVLRFPLTIYSKDLLERHIFTEDSVTISPHSGAIEEERWRYFVTTKSDGSHLYCTAQDLIQEKAILTKCLKLKMNKADSSDRQSQEFYIPKCLVLMSSEPIFKMHVNLLRIYRQILKPNPSICHPITPRIISSYLRLKGQGRTDEFNLGQNAQEGKRAKPNMILDYYIQKMNEHRGRQMLLLQKITKLPILHLYPMRSNQLFQFSHFFNLPLSSQTISTAIAALLLEKQIIFVSKSSNQTVMVIESLLEIIKPLKWQHMLVHNLPSHLLDAVNENFMPFIVGVNQKHFSDLNTQNRFIMLVDEDRIIQPEHIVTVDPLNQFSRMITKTTPSLYNERHFIALSVEFMCQLLKPLYQNKSHYQNTPFYDQFLQTSLYSHFVQQIEKNQLEDFVQLLTYQQTQQRMMRIERQLNDLTYYFQNPKQTFNEIEWIEYYLSRTNPSLVPLRKQKENKLLSLKEIKDSIINQSNRPKTTRQASAINRIRSQSTMQPRSSKSNQKIKVSMVRHDYCHSLLNQLLEQRLGVDVKLA